MVQISSRPEKKRARARVFFPRVSSPSRTRAVASGRGRIVDTVVGLFLRRRLADSIRSDRSLSLSLFHISLPKNRSVSKISAKYGDESVYFDLGDVESTTGSWDVYGVESTARYPDQQAKFFENAAQGLGRREATLLLRGVERGLILVWGGKGSKDAKLPITIGPQKEPVKGPRDRL